MDHLSAAERDLILAGLTEPQKEFLQEHLKRGKRTIFARHLVKQKGAAIPENATYEEIETLLTEWILTDYVDGGAVSPDLQCNCGRSLRYRYTVQHKDSGSIIHFGIDHLEQHLGIDAKTVAAVKKGFEAIDYELDEILQHVSNNWSILNNVGLLPEGLQLPKDIADHLTVGLPLLNRQLARLRECIRAHILDTRTNEAIVMPVYETTKETEAYEDLFTMNSLFIEKSGKPVTTMKLPLALQQAAEQLIKQGLHSVRIICEHLIAKYQAPNERFISNKPHIYIPLCIWLESQMKLGNLELVYSDQEDRKYQWIESGR